MKPFDWLEEAYHDQAGSDIIFLKIDRMLIRCIKSRDFQALVAKVFAREAAAASEGHREFAEFLRPS